MWTDARRWRYGLGSKQGVEPHEQLCYDNMVLQSVGKLLRVQLKQCRIIGGGGTHLVGWASTKPDKKNQYCQPFPSEGFGSMTTRVAIIQATTKGPNRISSPLYLNRSPWLPFPPFVFDSTQMIRTSINPLSFSHRIKISAPQPFYHFTFPLRF